MTPKDNSAKSLAQTIAAIGSPGFEANLNKWLMSSCKTDNIIIVAYFEGRAPDVLFSYSQEQRVFENVEKQYIQGAYLLDPVFALHVDHRPEGLYHLKDIAPDQFQRSEYYATYFGYTTLVDELIFLSHPAPGVSVTICLGRDATSKRKFSARMIEHTRSIAPIVTELANKHWSGLTSAHHSGTKTVADKMRDRLQRDRGISLSPRQSEIAFMVLQGHSSSSVGMALGISPQTVKVFRKQIHKKCQISSQAELFSLLTPYLI